MRRPLLIGLLVLALSLTAVSAASARGERGFVDSDIELIEGSGRVTATVRGAMIGSVQGTGTVTVTDLPDRATTQILVLNETASWTLDSDTTVYAGEDLRFRVFRGKWRVKIQGDGIFTSIVGAGTIGFVGEEGRYSLAGAPYRPWPAEWTTLRLGDE
jgi:hypothetical protein